jgi:hypothetical protein
MKFLHPINLVQNELQNARIQNLATPPADPKIGQIYFNTVSSELKVWDGSSWDVVGKEYELGNDILKANVSTSVNGADNTLTYTRFENAGSGTLSLDAVPASGTSNLTWSGIFNTNSITLHSPSGTLLTADSTGLAVTSSKATATNFLIQSLNAGSGTGKVTLKANTSVDFDTPVINLTDDVKIDTATNDIVYTFGSSTSKLNWEDLGGNVTLLLPNMLTNNLYGTEPGQKTTFTLATTDDVPPITPIATLFEFTYDDDPSSEDLGDLILKAFESAEKDAGRFYLGTVNPTNTTRLNYDGNLHVKNMFADNITTGSFNDLALTALTDGFSIAGGTVDERELIVTGGDVTLTGTGTGSGLTLPEGTITINNLTANHVLYASATDTISGEAQLAVTRGGTGIGSYAVGDLLYADGTTSLAKRAIGTTDQFLRVAGGEPVWSDLKTIDTTNTTAQTPVANETIFGTGVIDLHKVAKTGDYYDLLSAPEVTIVDESTETWVSGFAVDDHEITISRASETENTVTFGEVVVKIFEDELENPTTSGKLTVEGNSDLNGNVLIGGNTEISGNLTVNGTTTTLNTQEVTIEDNLILINSNQTGEPSSLLMSGLEVNRGDFTNYRFVFSEAKKDFRIGKYDDSDSQNIINELQPVLTRDEISNLVDGQILVWNETTKRAETESQQDLQIGRKRAFDLEIASGQTYTITHNLNTTDVIVSLKDVTSGSGSLNEMIYADIKTTGVNTITVGFGEINGVQDVRVTIIG